jgi:hypothetical protein
VSILCGLGLPYDTPYFTLPCHVTLSSPTAITVDAQNLATAQVLNVTVGGMPATLLNGSGSVIDPNHAQRDIIGPGPFTSNYTWAIHALIPAGQGLGQAVQVKLGGGKRARAWARQCRYS